MALFRTSSASSVGDVFALIRHKRDLTRTEIGRLTGLSRTAVTARVSELTSRDLVVEREQAPSTGGRPAALLSFNADAGVVLTAAVGGSRTRLAVCNLAGDVLTAADIDQEPGLGPQDLMPQVVKGLEVLLAESGHSDTVYGVGLSLPGTVDQERGSSIDTPVLSGWDGAPLIPYFRELTEAPVVLGNDANVIALAEWRAGAGRGFDDLLVVKASTGLGAGIIAGGALQRGAIRAAGEFGHNKTVAAEGRPCRCGDTGCLETVAGGWALVRTLAQEGRPVRNLRDLVELAHSGDALARRHIRDSGRYIGEVLAGAVNLLNPAALVVAGDVAGAYDIFVAGLRETLYGNATALATRVLEIRPAQLGDRGGSIGSAMMVLDQVLGPRAVDALIAA
ncbi:ROK family transcriptional regulator [Mycolicibacterium austroafricanum]|uniref:ROK family transcriptional regulator n=1 Tax=Mycolicibacterium austroafricanum TaxID=39687 RepID=A0ABT8HJ26_MYCAO|nr:ROK family transcriptional regulator [Mycolicibacterium austroafricanum]MDN4520765.1 ROK family transcriptional regulator [Mycolicibacterium austroafricanum]QRZ05989.1 ROK family transcriptional regulator [Mycolicibacterium austroafricanum]QZT67473.1 ROK family transcriptional regulator [Mycolicibacterium austroafricanum]